jgi:hypothetical protein
MKYQEISELVADLREFADLIEKYGVKLPLSYPWINFHITQSFYNDEEDEDGKTPKDKLKEVVRILPGKKEKGVNYHDYEVVKYTKNGHCKLTFETAQENVCEKKVIGTEKIQRYHSVPIEGSFTEKEIVEWECNDSLLK